MELKSGERPTPERRRFSYAIHVFDSYFYHTNIPCCLHPLLTGLVKTQYPLKQVPPQDTYASDFGLFFIVGVRSVATILDALRPGNIAGNLIWLELSGLRTATNTPVMRPMGLKMYFFFCTEQLGCANRTLLCRELWAGDVLGSPLLRTSAHFWTRNKVR